MKYFEIKHISIKRVYQCCLRERLLKTNWASALLFLSTTINLFINISNINLIIFILFYTPCMSVIPFSFKYFIISFTNIIDMHLKK